MFKGAFTAIVTPFDKDGKINYEKFKELIEFQIENKIDGIVVCGTTGESSTLTQTEKKELIKYTVDTVNKRIPVIAGTGSNSTAASIELSTYAESVGADGLLLVTPYYNKANQEGLYLHYSSIASNVSIPCIIYNVPSRTGVNILPDTVVRLSKISNICGIKEASNNFSQILELMSRKPKNFDVLSGNDDSIVPLLSLGGSGVISVLSNIYPKDVHDMCKLYDKNYEDSLSLQLKHSNLIKLLFTDVNPMPVKEAMNILGFNVGKTRLPLSEINLSLKESLKAELLKDRCNTN